MIAVWVNDTMAIKEIKKVGLFILKIFYFFKDVTTLKYLGEMMKRVGASNNLYFFKSLRLRELIFVVIKIVVQHTCTGCRLDSFMGLFDSLKRL